MNKPILCCLKIKPATLLIGTLDLFFHMMLLASLFASYTHPDLFDGYYTNSISLISSSSASCLSPSGSYGKKSDLTNMHQQPIALPYQNPSVDSSSSSSSSGSSSGASSGDVNNNNINKVDLTVNVKNPKTLVQQDSTGPFNEQYFRFKELNNSNMSKDKSMIFLITLFSALITTMLIYGILRRKPSYLMPYFSIKVFQVVMASLTTLGFYSCLPDVRIWIAGHHYFPFKNSILLLDNQTLELFVFSILLTSILAKLYAAIIVWYCYRYMITVESFNNLNSFSSSSGGANSVNNGIVFDDNNNPNNMSLFKVDEESILTQPPKYEDVIKYPKEYQETVLSTINDSNSNGSSSLNSTSHHQNHPRSNSIDESIHSDTELSSVPSYSTAIASKQNHLKPPLV